MSAIQETQKFCMYCQRTVLARRPGTNHLLHFLITFFTCGLWAIMWLWLSLTKFGGWKCPQCGSGV